MADTLTSVMTLDTNKIFRGPSRLVYARSDMTAPTELSDIINTSTFVLASGYIDWGFTDEDGVRITREADLFDGIPLDQRKTALYEGEPERWRMALTANMVQTDIETLYLTWELETPETIGGGTERKVAMSAPTALTSRRLCVLQMDNKTEVLRALWFRDAIPMQESSEMQVADAGAAITPLAMKLSQDLDVTEANGSFGLIYEQVGS